MNHYLSDSTILFMSIKVETKINEIILRHEEEGKGEPEEDRKRRRKMEDRKMKKKNGF